MIPIRNLSTSQTIDIITIMLTVIAGEDIVASRKKLLEVKTDYVSKKYNPVFLALSNILDKIKIDEQEVNLFGDSSVYFIENLSKKYNGRQKTVFKDSIVEFSKNRNITLVDWEAGKSAYDISGLKRIATTFIECKPSKSIFELLDSCYPKNLKTFIKSYRELTLTQDEMFIFIMLVKHIRNLILAKVDALPQSIKPWQRSKLTHQSALWTEKNLVSFYDGLAKIDIALKTGASSYSIGQSLELLLCYYVR